MNTMSMEHQYTNKIYPHSGDNDSELYDTISEVQEEMSKITQTLNPSCGNMPNSNVGPVYVNIHT